MARFIATIEGQAGPASRIGSARSGIIAHPRGRHVGVKVEGIADQFTDEDVFRVYATSGSNGGAFDQFIGSVVEKDGRVRFHPGTELEQRLRAQFARELIAYCGMGTDGVPSVETLRLLRKALNETAELS